MPADAGAACSVVGTSMEEVDERIRNGATSSLRRQTGRATTKLPPGESRLLAQCAGRVAEGAGAGAGGLEVALQAEPAELQGRRVVGSHRIVLFLG
jgi:hypothetical protein